jgi:hypothetical protein
MAGIVFDSAAHKTANNQDPNSFPSTNWIREGSNPSLLKVSSSSLSCLERELFLMECAYLRLVKNVKRSSQQKERKITNKTTTHNKKHKKKSEGFSLTFQVFEEVEIVPL